ncbi:MAG: C69 family dipeptidase [Caldilineaceae bacterium]
MPQISTLPRFDTPQSCDTMVALANATRNSQTIFAKNSDRPADECQPLVQRAAQTHAPGSLTQCQFVTLPQAENTHRHVGSRPYWCWGYEHGFNEHQVVIGNEALPSKLPEATEPKLVGMELLRLGLERGRTAAEAVEVITGLVTQYGQGKFANDAGVRTYDNGYIVADPHEAYVIETAGHEWAVQRVQNAIGISNVYSVETHWEQISPTARQTAIEHGWPQDANERLNFADAYTANSRTEGSGAMRRARSCAVLNGRWRHRRPDHDGCAIRSR